MGAKVRVKGDSRRSLTRVRVAVKGALEKAVAEESAAIADDMRQRAPVGDRRRGRRGRPTLKQSIRSTHAGLRATAKATAKHAGIVEHGTSTHRAQPFATPAAEISRRRFPKRVTVKVKRAVE